MGVLYVLFLFFVLFLFLCRYTAQKARNFVDDLKIFCMKDKKQELSAHVEEIFKQYVHPGLYICDLATGGGKSYTIGKLTCEYYPKHFERIIILCVQNKLIEGMNREIEKFIDQPGCLKLSEKLVIENNTEVILKAVRSGSLQELLAEMGYQIEQQRKKKVSVAVLENRLAQVEKLAKCINALVAILQDDSENASLLEQIQAEESRLRYAVRDFFANYKKHLLITGEVKKVGVKTILSRFPSLERVYPQVNYASRKVFLMTVHKAMLGIDPILSESVCIRDFCDKKTLILFDESDQAAVAMRDVIIGHACRKSAGFNKYGKGYHGYLQYLGLLSAKDTLTERYDGTLLKESLEKAQKICQDNWERKIGDILPYKNIFLADTEEYSSFRRGVFFAGPTFKLEICGGEEHARSFICYLAGEKNFILAHAENEEELFGKYDMVISLDKFLKLSESNTMAVKKFLSGCVRKAFQKRQDAFRNETDDREQYLGWPTVEGEIHSLLARFEVVSEKFFEQQLLDYYTNRKNLTVKMDGKKYKVQDDSFYMHGCRLYQEELDERDSLHRVRLSCREISSTPEKILYDLVVSDKVAVVLCSATASSESVISNFDIEYLMSALDRKVHLLDREDSRKFEELVEATYPSRHQVEVVPLEHYMFKDSRKEHMTLPEKYKQMFCEDAVEEGLVDRWFKLTRRKIFREASNADEAVFEFYRIFQFIEAYHWFHGHDDIHSMLFFQNRAAQAYEKQMNVIACLIDGFYKQKMKNDDHVEDVFESGLPDWQNEHLFMSNSLKDVEDKVLKRLSDGSISKVMLVTAYGSFKAGANLQYKIPEGIDYERGDNWEEDEHELKKDWDAVYLQSPTSYLSFNDDSQEQAFDAGLYRIMMSLMMLNERSWLTQNQVGHWLEEAISKKSIRFKEDAVAMDKAAWAQTMIEQAVGRICRTRNKPLSTYVLYDEGMTEFFMGDLGDKSHTKEFKALSSYIQGHTEIGGDSHASAEEVKLHNDSQAAQCKLRKMREKALLFTPHPYEVEYENLEDGSEDLSIPYYVKRAQIMNQYYKQAIIRNPVVASLQELDEQAMMVPFLRKCYGNWERDEDGSFCQHPVSPSSVRLDVLMKNPVIREHFERNGYATGWSSDGLILHPEILMADYAGEIGEEAFKALVLRYTDCREEQFAHLEDRDYELADFVVLNPDGSYKVAFDVKNMNPSIEHLDRDGDMPTAEKRQEKVNRLGCPLYTINMLKMPFESMDRYEICGVIDEDGHVQHDAIMRIKGLIER